MAKYEVSAAPAQLADLVDWIGSTGAQKVAVEGSKGYGLALARLLLSSPLVTPFDLTSTVRV